MSVEIKYKGNTIASANTNTTKTIKTSGKYCEADIIVENTPDGGITPTGNINITDTNPTDVTNYATATVVSENLTAENIKKNVNILGVVGTFEGGGGGSLPSVISKIDGGSFTFASDTLVGNYTISHNLGVMPSVIAIWSDNTLETYSVETVAGAVKFSSSNIEHEEFANFITTGTRMVRGQVMTANSATSTEFFFKRNNTYYKAGVTYKWIAWA